MYVQVKRCYKKKNIHIFKINSNLYIFFRELSKKFKSRPLIFGNCLKTANDLKVYFLGNYLFLRSD